MSEKEKYHISKFYIKMLITIVFQSHSVMSDSLQPHRYIVHRNSPGQNTLVGSCSLLQWIFLTQGLNPVLLHCRWILYQLSYEGSTNRIILLLPHRKKQTQIQNSDVSTAVGWLLMRLFFSHSVMSDCLQPHEL